MMLLKGMAWLGSMAGYVGFFAEAGPRWAAPLTAACSVSLILYAAGLAGLLQPCAWLLLVCGLCLADSAAASEEDGTVIPGILSDVGGRSASLASLSERAAGGL